MNKKNGLSIYILVGIIIILLGIVLISAKKVGKEDTNTPPSSSSYDLSAFNLIQAEDINDFSKDKIYVVMIGRKTCNFSKQILPILKEAGENYDFQTNYISLEDIVDENGNIKDRNAFTLLKQLDTEEDEHIMDNFGYTPMLLFIKNKKIIKSYLGFIEYDKLSELLDGLKIKKIKK